MRIVTLLPSATEIVYALGLEPVAVSHECDYPAEAAEKPVVSRSRIDSDSESESINKQMIAAEREYGSVYEIDLDSLKKADPDLIITQGICEVCAVDHVLVEDAVDTLNLDADILTTDPHTLDDVLEEIRQIGAATGTEERAADLVMELNRRIRDVNSRVNKETERPRVLVLDWMDPVMVAGHWVPGLVSIAGGQYGLVEAGRRSKPMKFADLRTFDPEILIVAPCGFSLNQTLENSNELKTRPNWNTLTAVQLRQVFAMDGHRYFNRPGPSLIDALEDLAGVIHPNKFPDPPDEVVHQIISPQPDSPHTVQ